MTEPLSPQEFASRMDVSRETLRRLEQYANLLVKWQGSLALVGKSTLPDLWRRHMLDSAQLLFHVPTNSKGWLDIGSGAGFPGMVLAILGADDVHLVESNRKKCEFLHEVARQTETAVHIHAARLEELTPWPINVVTARAVAPLDELLNLAQPFISQGTRCLFLKGQHVARELTDAGKYWKMSVERKVSASDHSGTILSLTEVSHV